MTATTAQTVGFPLKSPSAISALPSFPKTKTVTILYSCLSEGEVYFFLLISATFPQYCNTRSRRPCLRSSVGDWTRTVLLPMSLETARKLQYKSLSNLCSLSSLATSLESIGMYDLLFYELQSDSLVPLRIAAGLPISVWSKLGS